MNSQMANKVDHTIDGKCSGCGACCSAILCVSDAEVKKIKKYLGQHPEVKMINRNTALDKDFKDICPFLNKENKCQIYEVRPEICSRFICSAFKDTSIPPLNHRNKRIINMITTFMGEKICPNAPDLVGLNKFYESIFRSRLFHLRRLC